MIAGLAFVLGLVAGLVLALAVLLVLALAATRRRQEHLDQLIAGGRR